MADTTITPEMQAWLDAGNKPKAKPQATPVFQPEADVNVISPDGEAGTVKGSTVDSFLRAGYQLEDSAGTHERVLKKEYGNSPILAGTLGAARGATLGLSDLAIRGFGGREAADALERLNPISSTIGELGGALAGSFIPGMGFIGGAGHAAEEAVAGSRVIRSFAEGGKFAQAAARYAPVLARGAVEGAIYGAGGGVSQTALSADPMTAEAVLGDMATGALIGAPLGAAMAGGGKFLSDTAAWAKAKYASHVAEAVAPEAELASGVESKVAGAANDAVAEAGAEVGAKASPLEAAVADIAETPVSRVDDSLVEDFKTKYHDQDTISRKQFRQFESGVKRGKIIETPELKDAVMAAEDARVKVRRFLPIEGAEDGSRTYEQILDGKQLGGSYAKGQGKSIASWTGDNEAITKAAQSPGFREAVIEHQAAIDRVQELLGNNPYPPVIDPNHPVFGGPKGAPPSSIPPAATTEVNAKANSIRDVLGMPHEPPIDAAPKAPPVNPMNPMGAAPVEPAAAPMAGHAGPPGAAKAAANSLFSRAATLASSNALGLITGSGLALSTANPLNQYLKDHGVDSPFVRSLISGTVGVIATSKIRGALNPIREMLFGRAGQGVSKLAAGVDALLSGKKPIAGMKKAANAILGGAVFAVVQSPEHKKGTVFQQRAAELTQTLANPMEARRAIHNNLAGVRAADPMLSDQMEELAFARLMFLGEKMPKDPGAGAQLGKRKPWQPSDSEIIRWARYIEASEHPETVLHSVADGTVTPEQVETMKTLYPVTYQRVRGDIVARSAELQKTLTWDQRLSLGVLFEVPTDDILRPENVTAMQNNFLPSEPDKQANGAKMPSIKAPVGTRAQQLASH